MGRIEHFRLPITASVKLTMTSCPDCKKGDILFGEPSGTMVNNAYFAAGPAGNTSRVIVLLTDIFGLPLVNCKIIADNLSKRLACDVWVPDLFNGALEIVFVMILCL